MGHWKEKLESPGVLEKSSFSGVGQHKPQPATLKRRWARKAQPVTSTLSESLATNRET